MAGSSQACLLEAQPIVSRVLAYLWVSHAVEAAVALRHVTRVTQEARAEPTEGGRTTPACVRLSYDRRTGPLWWRTAAAGVAARFLQARVSCVGGSGCEGGT